jgi:DNA-binding transcriptional regulator YdaS (Cro superfamily)
MGIMNNPLLRAIEICGSQKSLGARIGKGQYLVSAWVRRGCRVSSEFVIAVSKAIDWQITPHELRPDIYPHPHDGLPDHMRSAA